MIGIFDSGLGGLSIYRGIKSLLSEESVIYLADQGNFPYGGKSRKELEKISLKNSNVLIEKEADMVVVACNTATIYAIDYLRKEIDIPFVGVVPVVKTCASVSRNGRIGILATKGTIKSKYQKDLIKKFCPLVETFSADGSVLIALVEKNFDNIKDQTLLEVLKPLLEKGVDTIALGCTHYHFLLDRFQGLVPEVTFLGSEGAVARQVKRVLEAEGLLGKNGKGDRFITSGGKENLQKFLKEVLKIDPKEIYEI